MKKPNSELERLSPEAFLRAEKTPVIILLDDVRSLHNIGSVFRTADAFLVEAIYLCGITAKPPHRDIRKTALGATETVAWQYFKTVQEAISTLDRESTEVWAIEQTYSSISLADFVPSTGKKLVLAFGNEVKGVSGELIDLADGSIEIPQIGTKHSLNISVATGIVIWEVFTKLKALKG